MGRNAALAEFARGLTQPSRTAVAVALVVIVTFLGGCLLTITPSLIAGEAIRYFASTRYDYDAFVTSRTFEIAGSKDTRPLVALVGASVTRMSFGTERDIEEAIQSESGIDVEVAILCTGRQNYLENMTIIDSAMADRPIVFVVGVAPGRFAWDDAGLAEASTAPRLGMRSEAALREAERFGAPSFESSGNYFLDNRGFVLPRMKYLAINGFLRGPVKIQENRYTGLTQPPKALAARNRAVAERLGEYEAHFDHNATVLGDLVTLVHNAGQEIALVEEAVNPDFVAEYPGTAFYDSHAERMAALAEEIGAPYWTITREAGLAPDMFYDWAHINDLDARAALRSMLVAKLEPLLRD